MSAAEETAVAPAAIKTNAGAATQGAGAQARLALRFALREMRAGLSGFLIFLACIALGAAAIGGVNSVAQSITTGIASEGRVLLGGDLRFELNHRETTPQEQAFLDSLGAVSHAANMRSMARRADGADQALVELKAVDAAWPMVGAVVTEPQAPIADLLAERDGAFGAVAPDLLLQRLSLSVGDRLNVGAATFEIRARLVTEPDAVSDGFGFAPRLLTSLDALRASQLLQPGSLVEHVYKIDVAGEPGEAALRTATAEAREKFPEAGWSIRSRSNAAPALAANIERFSQFLTLVGLTALVVGGVGVGNAVRAHLDSKRGVIATLKCLGASGGLAFAVYLIQILLIAAIGIAIGLVLAALTPPVAGWALQNVLPVAGGGGFFPGALATAALFAFLTTLLFALPPLGRARDVPATALFREQGFEARGWPRAPYLIAAGALALLLAGLAIALSVDRFVAAVFIGGVAFAFVVLRLLAVAVQALAKRAPKVRSAPLRLAIGNIHRPGALTPSVVLALGLGLTLLAALALIDGNLRRQISGSLPQQAPNFFFVDIQNAIVDDFATLVESQAPNGDLQRVPMLRGRIMALNGVEVAKLTIPAEGGWVLRGDRGITYAATPPQNAVITGGEWWPADHAGEPLVSFTAEEAGEIGLKVGDTITVNVLGRNITARIANLREVKWESLSINFVMVFSPNTFAGAPHGWLATLTDRSATAADESRLLGAVTKAFPAVTTVRVKDAIDVVNALVAQLATAIRAAAAVALIASVLVLSGALAAGKRRRVPDAGVLKTSWAHPPALIPACASMTQWC